MQGGKSGIAETLALDGIGKALKIKDWFPRNMAKNLGGDPRAFRYDWGKVALATAIWLQAVTSIMNPILMYFQYKRDRTISHKERTMLIAQETAKQAVHLSLHVLVMIIGVTLAKNAISGKLVKLAAKDANFAAKVMIKDELTGKKVLDKSLITGYETAISNIAGCLAGAIGLPILGATLFKYLDKKMGFTDSHVHEGGKKPEEKKQTLNQVSTAPSPIPHALIYHQQPVIHPAHPVHLQGTVATQLVFAGQKQTNQPMATINAFNAYSGPHPLALR